MWNLLHPQSIRQTNSTKMLVMDVDGTLTDGTIYCSDSETEIKAFNVKDGYGIKKLLPHAGIIPVIITGRKSMAVEKRCKELNVTILYQNANDKLSVLKELLNGLDIAPSNVAYIGDDENDRECMEFIKNMGGIVACPRDASTSMKPFRRMKANGGDGAVREFINYLLERNGSLKK